MEAWDQQRETMEQSLNNPYTTTRRVRETMEARSGTDVQMVGHYGDTQTLHVHVWNIYAYIDP